MQGSYYMTYLLFSCSVMSEYYLPGSSVHDIFQAKNTEMGCHFLLHIMWLDNYNSLNWEQNKSHRIKV